MKRIIILFLLWVLPIIATAQSFKVESVLDITFDNLVLDSSETFSRDTLWHNPYGERSSVKDAYNGLLLHFIKKDASKYRLGALLENNFIYLNLNEASRIEDESWIRSSF